MDVFSKGLACRELSELTGPVMQLSNKRYSVRAENQ
jgi:hypothetical protein